MPVNELDAFIDGLPKAELHMHLEGSLEPELILDLASRNALDLPWTTADQLRAAYQFDNLESFLELFWAGCRTLVHEQDFYDMTMAYLRRARRDNVLHAELFLAMQNFTPRGIEPATVMRGVKRAFNDAASELGISGSLMIIAQRHRTEEAAFEMLEQLLPWSEDIVAIGMGGPEVGHPPSKFANFLRSCRDWGFRVVIHAGEEGPASYVREAFELDADRIDHGNSCVDDPALVRAIAERQTPLTLCPISNLRLKGIPAMEAQPLRRLMEQGVRVTINSDDPSYFQGYVSDNFKACREAFGLTKAELTQLARNSFTSSFLPPEEKQRYLDMIDAYVGRQSDLRSDQLIQ
jgi:adenosine deaminase